MRWHRYCVAHPLTGRYVYPVSPTEATNFKGIDLHQMMSHCLMLLSENILRWLVRYSNVNNEQIN